MLLITSCKEKKPLSQMPFPHLPLASFSLQETTIKTFVALAKQDQIKGLSGIQEKDWDDDMALLFYYSKVGPRSFWMPDTYFDLDIFFLDEHSRIIHVERNVAKHPGLEQPPAIAKTPTIYSFSVLEMKSASKWSKSLKVGDQIKWDSFPTLQQIKQGIHQTR